MTMKIKQIGKDSELVLAFDHGWTEDCQLSDLGSCIYIGVDNIPALVKELNKFYKKTQENK